jgi:hypothetical protein
MGHQGQGDAYILFYFCQKWVKLVNKILQGIKCKGGNAYFFSLFALYNSSLEQARWSFES